MSKNHIHVWQPFHSYQSARYEIHISRCIAEDCLALQIKRKRFNRIRTLTGTTVVPDMGSR